MAQSSEIKPGVPELPSDVIARWAPVLFLHHNDHFHPVPFEYFIRHGSLRLHPLGVNDEKDSTTLVPTGQLSQESLLSEAPRLSFRP